MERVVLETSSTIHTHVSVVRVLAFRIDLRGARIWCIKVGAPFSHVTTHIVDSQFVAPEEFHFLMLAHMCEIWVFRIVLLCCNSV